MSLPSSPDKLPPVRTIGVLALVLGLVFFYQSIYQPISDAASHKPTISVWGKGAFIVPGLLAFGITYTVFGERTLKYLGWGVNRATPLGWAFIILWIPLGILVYMWVESVVKSYGYSTSLSQNETSKKLVFVNQPIFDLFQAHGIDCQQQGEWIVFPKHAAKICGVIGREWEPKQGTYTVQLDVRVSLDSGHRIIEAFGGFGDTKKKQLPMASRTLPLIHFTSFWPASLFRKTIKSRLKIGQLEDKNARLSLGQWECEGRHPILPIHRPNGSSSSRVN